MNSSKEMKNTLITKEVTDASGNPGMRIDHGALRRVLMQKSVCDKPIALISIAGCMRTGKSFLMNFILRYFRNKGWENSNWIGDGETSVNSNDIPWKGGAKRVTTGLRIFHEIFEVPWKDQTMMVMIMDTQGLFDFHTTEIMNKAMLTLTTLLSSVQIFNTMQQINAQHLNYLKTCVDFALEAAKSNQSKNYLRLQRLIFLVRDFCDQEDESDMYTLEFGKKHLADILGSEDGGYELTMTRQGIKKSFQEVDCFPLPHPGMKATKTSFKGLNRELEKEFLQAVKLFIEAIASPTKLTPKSSNRKWLTARELLNMIAACDTNFYNNRFEANVMIEANEKAYYAAEYEEAIQQYRNQMKDRIGNEQMNENRLAVIELEVRQNAIRRFDAGRKMGPERPFRADYERHLIDKCDEYVRYLKDQIRSDQEMRDLKKNKSTQEAMRWYDREMQADKILAEEELKSRHKEKYEKLFAKYKNVADVDELKRKVAAKYNGLSASHQDNRKEQETQKKREKELFSLIRVKLNSLCSEKWKEHLTGYADQARMEMVRQKVEQEIRDEYWRLALTPTEKKFRDVLEKRMKTSDAQAVTAALPEATPRLVRYKVEKFDFQKPEEREISELVKKTYEQFLRQRLTLQKEHSGSKEDLNQLKQKLEQEHLMEYFKCCCEYLPVYFRRLDGILQACYKDVCLTNDEIWGNMATSIKLTVNRLILEHESELQEIMIDRHIDDKELQSHYHRTVQDLLQTTPKELSTVFQGSEKAKGFFKEELKRKMSTSLSGVLEKNQRDREKRMVEDHVKPKTPGFMDKLKKFFGF